MCSSALGGHWYCNAQGGSWKDLQVTEGRCPAGVFVINFNDLSAILEQLKIWPKCF